MNRYKIICFSFAGGSKYSFHAIKSLLPDHLEMVVLEYPGRGTLMTAPLLKDVDQLVDVLLEQMRPHLASPYLIYGHSMGGLIAWKMALKLRQELLRLPDGLFLTGCRAPSTWENKKPLHNLPYDELVVELKTMGGIPKEVLEDDDTMRFFEPILRADFEVVASYEYEEEAALPIPFKVMVGTEEELELDEAKAWQQESSLPLDFQALSGGHFFIFDHAKRMIEEFEACRQKWRYQHFNV